MNSIDNQTDVFSSSSSSPPPMEKEISVVKDHLSILTLDAQPLPNLSLDLIEEILCRLPAKLLIQLQCVCKSWNALISDPIFAKKHLSMSTSRLVHFLDYSDVSHKYILRSYPIQSVFDNITTDFNQYECPIYDFNEDYPPYPRLIHNFCSCNGILCLADAYMNFVVWNPSIRKFKELPPYQMPQLLNTVSMSYGFGYDPFNDNYKVVVVHILNCYDRHCVDKSEVKIHTLGTNSWKTIQDFPFGGTPIERTGKFVSGAINWLGTEDLYTVGSRMFIVSLDLKNESFQEILMPGNYGDVDGMFKLGVMRDWLCLICGDDIWVMKEFGNEESWTKLFTIFLPPHVRASDDGLIFVINFIEDGQVLLKSCVEHIGWKLIVYDSKNGTFKIMEFENDPHGMSFESLISPC